jgi:tetratricopeptide (TPR) repeat protein/cellulose biosynthesis protein BcsQ
MSAPAVQIVTFYSYKGGVGRTMALANSACQLANKHGFDVIAIDWDLEAPGLHYYFGYKDSDLRRQPGLIDYLEEFISEVKKGKSGSVPDLTRFLITPTPSINKRIRFGSVRILTCGRTDGNYLRRIRCFSWDDFYEIYSGFQIIETMKKSLKDNSDITLIDARSGQSESGATPTVQMPDAVVLLFTSNQQSLDGISRIARFLKNHPTRTDQRFPDLRLLLIPSRVFVDSPEYTQWVDGAAKDVYERLLTDSVAVRVDQPKGLHQCALPINEHASVGEALPVLEPEHVRSPLRQAYEELVKAIEDLHAGRALWSIPSAEPTLGEKPPDPEEHQEALRFLNLDEVPEIREADLTDAIRRGDSHQSARLRYQLGVRYFRAGNYSGATASLSEALSYYRQNNESFAVVVIIWMSRVNTELGQLEEAWDLLNDAAAIAGRVGDIDLTAAVLYEMAMVRRSQRRFDEATSIMERALEAMEAANSPQRRPFYLHAMGHIREEIGDLDGAWDYFQKSLELAEATNSSSTQVENYYCMGEIRRRQRRTDEAIASYEMSANLSGARDSLLKAKSLFALAEIEKERHNDDRAEALYARALQTVEQASDVAGQRNILLNLGRLLRQRGKFDEARALFERGLAISDEIVPWKTRFMREIGTIERGRGNISNALNILQSAAILSHDNGDARSEGITLHTIAHVLSEQGNETNAAQMFQRALEIAERLGDIEGQIQNYVCLGDLRRSKGQDDEAFRLFSRVWELGKGEQRSSLTVRSLREMGEIRQAQGRLDEAYDIYKTALARAREEKDERREGRILLRLGDLQQLKKNIEDAEAVYSEALLKAEKAADDDTVTRILVKLGDIAHSRGEFPSALQRYEHALQIAERAGDEGRISEIKPKLQMLNGRIRL